ncbi:MAG: cyclic nucleotide-binding domain-containing protein [bacterium]|nr:cyclic nucleotide-binding domain-containing protein [bacterium]
MNKKLQWLPFYIYMGNYLFTFFLDIHFFNFSFQFLSLRNSKRILPLLMSGGKLGGIVAGLLIFTFFSDSIARLGIFLWLTLGSLLILPVLILSGSRSNKDARAPKKYKDLLPDTLFFERFLRKIKLSYSSPIFTYSALAIFVMAIANQLAEYYFADAFNKHFTTENELAAFLSIYTFVGDLATLLLQIFFVSKIIKNFGVQKTNYIYPISFIGFIALLFVAPGLVVGIFLRFYRKNLSLITRTPIFNILMAASPRDRMIEVKSFISAIISPLGMITGGGAILLITTKLSANQGIIFSLSIGALYVFLTFYQNRAYLYSLKSRLSFDSSGRYDKKIEFTDFEEFLSEETNIQYNKELIEDIFNDNPSVEALKVLYKYFNDLSLQTKENILSMLKTTSFIFSRNILSQALTDDWPIVRSTALSLIKDLRYTERKQLFESYTYDKQLSGERYAISLLTHRGGELSDFSVFEHLVKTKNEIITGSALPAEFLMIANTLPPFIYLDHLIQLVLETKNKVFLKELIPLGSRVSRRLARKIMYTYKDADINLLTGFIVMAKNLTDIDKAIILDYRKYIPEENMERIFRYNYNEKAKNMVVARLLKEKNYYQKSNYLNYIMAINVKPTKEMRAFIIYELEAVSDIIDIVDQLPLLKIKGGNIGGLLSKFLGFALKDMIDLHKHLILKAIALLTGTKIDEVYESNLLLEDKDLNSLILEYIESTGKYDRKLISLFENTLEAENKEKLSFERSYMILLQAIKHLKRFIPDVPIPGKLYYKMNVKGISGSKSPGKKQIILKMPKEDKDMLNLLEKIIFLKENNLFCDLNANELIHIAKITNEIEVPAEKFIIHKDESGDELFIIVKGEVEIFTEDKFLSKQGEGSCIGELSIIDAEPRSTNVKTTQKTHLLSIKRRDFLLTLREHPSISINVMKIVTGRLRNLI